MSLVIVPNIVADQINEKLFLAYQDCPEAEIDREYHYQLLLEYFDKHGHLPDFTLVKK